MRRGGVRREPERTCVGCHSKAPKADLVRVVRPSEGTARVDPTGKAAGRGAYVHRADGCLARAARSGALGRALKPGLSREETASLMKELKEAIGEHA